MPIVCSFLVSDNFTRMPDGQLFQRLSQILLILSWADKKMMTICDKLYFIKIELSFKKSPFQQLSSLPENTGTFLKVGILKRFFWDLQAIFVSLKLNKGPNDRNIFFCILAIGRCLFNKIIKISSCSGEWAVNNFLPWTICKSKDKLYSFFTRF